MAIEKAMLVVVVALAVAYGAARLGAGLEGVFCRARQVLAADTQLCVTEVRHAE